MVVIFSPQNWNHLFISKQHYALAFSKVQKTCFIEPTKCKFGIWNVKNIKPIEDNNNLSVVQLTLPFPDWFRFKFNWLYKKINTLFIQNLLLRTFHKVDLIIDFGCHRDLDGLHSFSSKKKIYFPVDDFENLPIMNRGADVLYTVSENIKTKFSAAGFEMKFINHGLAESFVVKAKERLQSIENGNWSYGANNPLKVGYSGNLLIPFLDRQIVLETIHSFPELEFHFYGNSRGSIKNKNMDWILTLQSFKNVVLHGQVTTEALAEEIFKMDILWLCYKPDYKNYHGENSHKINEYLSSGMPLVTSFISILDGNDIVYMANKNRNEETIFLFKQAIEEIGEQNNTMIQKRINLALENTYEILIRQLFDS